MEGAKVLVVYYSSYGHVFRMAQSVAEGARNQGAEVRITRVEEFEAAKAAMSSQPPYVAAQEAQKDIPVVTHDDLRWADAVAFGTPTRYGNMAAQLKQFLDTTGGLWARGELEGKAAGVFVSTATIHGGQETTAITTMVPLLHLGFVLVGTPYGENPQILTTEGLGGSPYGPGTLAGPDGSRQPDERELTTARNLGSRLAKVGSALRALKG